MNLSFGMFSVGVAMSTLFKTDDGIKAHLTCPEHHGRVKQAWHCEHGDHYIPRADLESTFEYAGQNIVLGDSEVKALESERDGIVRLTSSCPVADIDPSYFEKAYLMWPAPGRPNEQAYRALIAAMRNTGLALIGQVVISKTDRMLVIRWSEEHGAVLAHVCNFTANLKQDAVDVVSDAEQAWDEPTPEFIAQAETLLRTLEGDFDPASVEDAYQTRLAERLYAKINGGVLPESDDVEAAPIPDMMAALKATIDAANPKEA